MSLALASVQILSSNALSLVTMRYRLRTLLIVLAIGPPILAGGWLAFHWLAQSPDRQLTMWMLTPSIACATLAILAVIVKRLILIGIVGRRT